MRKAFIFIRFSACFCYLSLYYGYLSLNYGCQLTSTSKLLLILLTVQGFTLLEIIFFNQGDSLYKRVSSSDLITINFGNSIISFSEAESEVSFRLFVIICHGCVFCWSGAPQPTTESNFCWEFTICLGWDEAKLTSIFMSAGGF